MIKPGYTLKAKFQQHFQYLHHVSDTKIEVRCRVPVLAAKRTILSNQSTVPSPTTSPSVSSSSNLESVGEGINEAALISNGDQINQQEVGKQLSLSTDICNRTLKILIGNYTNLERHLTVREFYLL